MMKPLNIALYSLMCCVGTAYAAETQQTRLERLERVINTKLQTQVDMQQEIDRLRKEVFSLRGDIETQSHQMELMLNRQRKLYNKMGKLSEAKNAALPASRASIQDNTISEEASYQYAVDLVLKHQQFEKALIAFKAFQKQYPKSNYFDNALYWIGQIQFSKNKLDIAEINFNEIVNTFPKSNKRSDSLLKLGIIAQKQGHTAQAKQKFHQIIQEYPDSSSARLATTQIESIKQTEQL